MYYTAASTGYGNEEVRLIQVGANLYQVTKGGAIISQGDHDSMRRTYNAIK
jgi:hypothetical protein